MKSAMAVALGAALLAAPALRAQSRLDVEISPFAGETFFLHDGPSSLLLERPRAEPQIVEGARFEDTWSAGFGAGVRLSDVLGVEGLFSWTPTWLFGTNFEDGTDVYAYSLALSAVLHAPLAGRLDPFVGAGLGGELDDYSESIHTQAHWLATLQAGLAYDLGEGRSLRVMGRDFVAPFASSLAGVRSGWQHDLLLSAGVTWTIPLHRPRLAPVTEWRDLGPKPGK